MNMEKQKVLEMVADGTVTATEGVKLLKALESAGNKTSSGKKAAGKRRFSGTGSIIQEIGSMIQTTVGDVLKDRNAFEVYENSDLKEVQSVSEPVEQGVELVIYGSADKGADISISLIRSEDSTFSAALDTDGFMKSGGSSKRRILFWRRGELTIQVPDCAGLVKVFSRGGGISATGVRVPVELKTMGGGISVDRPGDSFAIKTMGGGLDILLDSTWKGDSRAKTMGGGVSVHLKSGTSAQVEASTLGGSISVSGNSSGTRSDSHISRGKSKVSVSFGESQNSSKLSVVSMGGGIVIEREADE
jgi:DUF4097 and DUF4098 domain-containing protein YvlB